MATYRIENTVSGITLGEWTASTSQEALDAFAKDAGYASYTDLCEEVPTKPGEIKVSEKEPAPKARHTYYVTSTSMIPSLAGKADYAVTMRPYPVPHSATVRASSLASAVIIAGKDGAKCVSDGPDYAA